MKTLVSVFLCAFALVLTTGCGGPTVPEEGAPATEAESVDAQLEDAGVSEEDYEKAMQQGMQEAGQ